MWIVAALSVVGGLISVVAIGLLCMLALLADAAQRTAGPGRERSEPPVARRPRLGARRGSKSIARRQSRCRPIASGLPSCDTARNLQRDRAFAPSSHTCMHTVVDNS